MSTKKRKRKRVTPAGRVLLTRIERLSRHAEADRLHGNKDRAKVSERKVNLLMSQAEDEHLGSAAFRREIRGQQAAGRLYHKIVKRRKKR